jgi:hypothetical protein
VGRDLYLGPVRDIPPAGDWVGSATAAVSHVLAPLASSGLLVAAAGWALAAAVLPWLVRGRSRTADVTGAVVWAVGLAAAGALTAALAAPALVHAQPHGSIAGPVAGAALAVALRAVRGPAPPRLRLPVASGPAEGAARV